MMRDLWACASRELLRRRGRTLANVLGYVLAVALMVVLVSVLLVSREESSRVLGSTGTHFILFAPTCDPICEELALDKQEGFVANGGGTQLVSGSLVAKFNRVPAIKHAAPYLLFRFREPKEGRTFTVGGFDPRDGAAVGPTCCAPSDILEGRFLTPDDRNAVLLEEAFARSRLLKAGDTLTIAGQTFPVVGVVNPGVRPAKADVYMPLRDAESVVNRRIRRPLKGEINAVLVEVVSSARQREAMEAAKRLLPDGVISSYACWKPASHVMGMNERAAWLLVLALGAAAVLLALKSQLSSVIERRHDIGILKAIGWSDGTIVAQVLAESALQGAVGGLAGCAAAAVLLRLLPAAKIMGPSASGTISPSIETLASGLLLALLGGVLAGVLPAYLAARQRPAEALRRL